jgi:hypothetical protein
MAERGGGRWFDGSFLVSEWFNPPCACHPGALMPSRDVSRNWHARGVAERGTATTLR